MHSPCTSSAAQVPQLEKFFNAQIELCGSLNRPLLLQSDCDKGVHNTYLKVLRFLGVEVVTRIQYHNLMLCYLAQYEVDKWDRSVTNSHFTTVRSLLPIFFANCRPNVLRAVTRWVKAAKRESVIKNQIKSFKILSYRVFSAATGMLTVSETIVAFGFMKYILSQEKLSVDRVKTLSKSSTYEENELKQMIKSCTVFLIAETLNRVYMS